MPVIRREEDEEHLTGEETKAFYFAGLICVNLVKDLLRGGVQKQGGKYGILPYPPYGKRPYFSPSFLDPSPNINVCEPGACLGAL